MWKGVLYSVLRCNQSLPKHANSQLTQVRHLNVSQTAEALRPFIFAVHPDFFGQYPKERAINEDSLKQLYAHIDGLRTKQQQQQVRPIDLKFYVRKHGPEIPQETQNDTNFKKVKISLQTNCLYKTVTHILQSCDLSTDHVSREEQNSAVRRQVQYGNQSTREATWDSFIYDYVEKRGPLKRDESKSFSKDDIDIPLCLWIKLNIEPAREKMVSTQPIRDEANQIKAELMEELGLTEIAWKCPWDINNFRSCLRILRDLVNTYPDIFENVEGNKVLFGNTTRLSYESVAVLGHRDTPQYWLGLVNSIGQFSEALEVMSSLEQQIGAHLGGVSVCRRHLDKEQAPFKAYYQVLNEMLSNLNKHQQVGENYKAIPAGKLKDLSIQIISGTRPPVLSTSGKIYVAHTTPPSAIQEYLVENQDDARQIMELNSNFKDQVTQLSQQCKEEHKFVEFNKKDTVTDEEMSSCCKRLLRDLSIRAMNLEGLKLRVGRHYNLLGSGEMCIPWNWK